jgi:hypothetical protein
MKFSILLQGKNIGDLRTGCLGMFGRKEEVRGRLRELLKEELST